MALASSWSIGSGATSDDDPSPMEILSRAATQAGKPDPTGAPATRQLRDTSAKPDEAKKPRAGKSSDKAVDYLSQCLRDWDAATHMTRQQWARTCRRVVSNRRQFLREQRDK